MTVYIAPIVEGHTEQNCLERLLHRIWLELLGSSERLQVLEPSRSKRDAIIHPNGEAFQKMVQDVFAVLARRIRKDRSGRGLILVLLDAERDCPIELAQRLLESARKARSDADIACVLAKRMFETWIVAGASTLAGVNGLPDQLPARDQFEDRSGVAWLTSQLRAKDAARAYKKRIDAGLFVQAMNLAECRANSPSFDKLCRELEKRLPTTADSADQTTQK
jgi:hypothetical protein